MKRVKAVRVDEQELAASAAGTTNPDARSVIALQKHRADHSSKVNVSVQASFTRLPQQSKQVRAFRLT